jgi:hypothetical protein
MMILEVFDKIMMFSIYFSMWTKVMVFSHHFILKELSFTFDFVKLNQNKLCCYSPIK